jgi:hypothetical protein
VLGPVLFLIYISDIGSELPAGVDYALFADDLKIFHPEENILQQGLDGIHRWSVKWQLPLNLSKLELLRIGRQGTDHNLTVGGEKLVESSSVRDLGVLVDKKLNFKDHIDKITVDANRKANFILRRFRHLGKTTLATLFSSTVRPSLEYCSTVWSPVGKTLIKKLEKVQRSFTKRIRGLKDVSYVERLAEVGLMTLHQRRHLMDLIMVDKITSGNSCNPREMFFAGANDRTLTLRGHSRRLEIPVHCHGVTRRMFWRRVLKPWNELPTEVAEANDDFKTRLSVYLRGT